ncbi:MAG: hypothetical protein A49_09090 [Methyloceanibacter sp.]|nr:MAG: hypothetical protein A49_09090 [Methyloceanibacter sp.]
MQPESPMPQVLEPLAWAIIHVVAPVAVGLLAGFLARRVARWLIVILVVVKLVVLLAVVGVLSIQMESLTAALDHGLRTLAIAGQAVHDYLPLSPVGFAAILTGLSLGLVMDMRLRRMSG